MSEKGVREMEGRLVIKGRGGTNTPLYKTPLHQSPWRNMLDSVVILVTIFSYIISSHLLCIALLPGLEISAINLGCVILCRGN
jgi:hypothetical protein